MRTACAFMVAFNLAGAVLTLWLLAGSETQAVGLAWAVATVSNLAFAGDNLRDAIHGW